MKITIITLYRESSAEYFVGATTKVLTKEDLPSLGTKFGLNEEDEIGVSVVEVGGQLPKDLLNIYDKGFISGEDIGEGIAESKVKAILKGLR